MKIASPPSLRLVFTLVLLVGGTGCIPEKVAWLPDSSGFIYTTGDAHERLMHYDADRDEWRVVAIDTGANTPWPAVDGTGKRICVVRAVEGTGSITVQLRIFSLDGNLVQKSSDFVFPSSTNRPSRLLRETAAAWSPKTNHILIFCGEDKVGVYDLRTDQLITVEGVPDPASDSPFTPDGRGFLVWKTDARKEKCWLDLVDWKGKHTALPESGLKAPTDAVYAFWKDNTFSLVTRKEAVELNVDKRTARFAQSMIAESARKDATQIIPFGIRGKDLAIRAATINSEAMLPTHSADLVDLSTNAATTLLKTDEPARLYASPDRKRVAVSCVLKGVPTIHYMSLEPDARNPKRPLARKEFPPGVLSSAAKKKSSPPSYVTTARCLAEGELLLVDQTAPKKDRTGMIADANRARLELSEVPSDDRTLNFIAKEGASGIESLTKSLEAIELLPKPKAEGEQLAQGFILGMLGQVDQAIAAGRDEQEKSEAVLSEARKAANAYQRIQAARLLLPKISAKHSGPTILSGRILVADLSPSLYWPGHYMLLLKAIPADGATLHNCTILITVSNENGEVAENVHFVREMKSGEVFIANYGPGSNFGDGRLVARQAVPNIKQLSVSCWCEEGTQEKISFVLTDAHREWAAAAQGNGITLAAKYQPSVQGLFGKNPGAIVTMNAPSDLPPCRIYVTLQNEKEQKTLWWKLDGWRRGETKELLSKDFSISPTAITLRLGFQDYEYEHFKFQPIR